MKKEQLYELLADVDEQAVKSAEKPPVKHSKRIALRYGIAAAACIAVVAGIGAWYHNSDKPLPKTDNNTEKKINMQLAAAVYPEIPMYPDDFDHSAYEEWNDAVTALRNQPAGYTDGFDSFFSDSIKSFLKGEETENKIYSPLSLYMTLGMCAEITDGSTRQQILDVLEQEDIDTLRSHAGSIWQANYMDDGMAKCIPSTSLWTNSNITYNKKTVDSVAENYYSSVFTGEPGSDEYNKLMQDWLNEQTDGLLADYVSDIEMSPETVLTVASAVNYSGKWMNKFDEERTESDTFHSAVGDVQCEFMNSERNAMYFWGDKFSSITMELENNGEMRFILPKEGISPEELINDDETVGYMMNTGDYPNSKYSQVNISVPKFDVSSNIDLADGLNELGITDIFDSEQADFTPLSESAGNVFLYKAEQDSRVLIDEEGCKASSLTAMMVGGAGMPNDYVNFVLDRPFVFEIMSETGIPIFVGIVNNPS